jgi:hypothetical protein
MEWVLGGLMLISFGNEFYTLLLWLIDLVSNRTNYTTDLAVFDAFRTLAVAFIFLFVAVLFFEAMVVRKAAYPILNLDELRAHVPIENLDQESFGPALPYNHKANWDRVFKEKAKGKNKEGFLSFWTTLIADTFRGQWSQFFWSYFHQIAWFLHLRGLNVVIRRGEVISTGIRKEYSLIPGLIISDVDSAYVLDPPHKVKPETHESYAGWYGMRFSSKRRLVGAASLHRKSVVDKDVTAFTSDGMEIVYDISGVFALGQRPECVQMAFNSTNFSPETLRVVKIKEDKQKQANFIKVSTDEKNQLDLQDRAYIYANRRRLFRFDADRNYRKNPDQYEFEYNPSRVVRAMHATAINNKGERLDWQQILTQHAKDVFAGILLNYTYDELFGDTQSTSGDTYPLDDIINQTRSLIRNDGVLAYRLLWSKSNKGILLDSTDHMPRGYHINDIENAPVKQEGKAAPPAYANLDYEELPAGPSFVDNDDKRKYLRACGIRVLACEIDNIRPRLPEVSDTLEQAYSAAWERDADFERAEVELDGIEVMNQAQLQAQFMASQHLLTILESDYPEEVVLLQLLSALQSMLNRSDGKNILLRDAYGLIGSLKQWLRVKGDKE